MRYILFLTIILFSFCAMAQQVDFGNNDIETSGAITASEFYGDGSNLTGIQCEEWSGGGGSSNDSLIDIFVANNQTSLDITDLDDTYGDCTVYLVQFFVKPHTAAALVVKTSTDGINFDSGSTDYSYSAVVFDNDNAMGSTLETRGPKIYGSNGDNRAHMTPNYTSNFISTTHGIWGEFRIRAPGDSSTITRMDGSGSFTEPDGDTDAFQFALARETSQVTKSVRMYFRDNGGVTRNISGFARLNCEY